MQRIHREMFPVYGGNCMLSKVVNNWVEKFSQGHSKVTDDAQPGCPVEIVTEATVQWVEELIRADRRITIDSVATALGHSTGLSHRIMHDRLKFQKVGTWWVARELKDQEKMNRMGLSLQHPLQYAYEGDDMLNWIVTGDKSWVRHYQPESKRASMQWKQRNEGAKWLRQQLKDFYAASFDTLAKQ
jgi:hypothetical protein